MWLPRPHSQLWSSQGSTCRPLQVTFQTQQQCQVLGLMSILLVHREYIVQTDCCIKVQGLLLCCLLFAVATSNEFGALSRAEYSCATLTHILWIRRRTHSQLVFWQNGYKLILILMILKMINSSGFNTFFQNRRLWHGETRDGIFQRGVQSYPQGEDSNLWISFK